MEKERKKYLIDDSTPLVEALRILNITGKRIVFLVKDGKLRGSLTYGDVSRWILKGLSLNAPAYDAATKNPIVVHEKDIPEVDAIFSEKGITALPVVDVDNNVIDVLFKDREKVRLEQVEMPVVIMAGGKGTRLYPYTKILPKPLIPIGEIPISEHIVNRFVANGCHEFFFIVNYKKNMVKAYYNELEHPYEVHFVDEDIPMGTGGGLSLMKGMLDSTFVLTNCDSFIDEDYAKIFRFHKERHNLVTMICSNQKYEVPYGVIETDADGNLVSMREKPSLRYLTNTGTYIVEPEVIDMVEPGISIGFPDVIQKVKDAGKNVGIFTVSGNSWIDMGQFDTMDEMKKRLNIKE
jgi:dTDP-glucose pyrophosphorylase